MAKKKEKKKADLACKKGGNYYAWDSRANLKITFLQPSSAAGRLQMCFSSFGVTMKVPQSVHFAFSSPWSQKSSVTQPSHRGTTLPVGKEWSKPWRAIGCSWQSKITNSAKQGRPKEEKAPPESKTFAFETFLFSQIKEHLCLVPSLHLV